MKLQTKSLVIATPLLLCLKSSQSFTVHHQQRQTQITHERAGRPLHIASLSRTNTRTSNDDNLETHHISSIDDELSAQNPDPKSLDSPMSSSFPSSSSSSSITSDPDMFSILEDGNGHINKELATSLWTWKNDNLQTIDSDPFPFASILKYSTRDGLRLVDSIATEMEQIVDDNESIEHRTDLVQEGVVALMKCMAAWDENQAAGENFETFATREISKSMRRLLRETSDGVGVLKVNLDLLREELEDLEKNKGEKTKAKITKTSKVQAVQSQSCDQIVKPLREAVLDENPTPDEIALSDMIRSDFGAFLERTLNDEELKVIRLTFGLEEFGTTLEAIALDLGKSMDDVKNIELGALDKLRTSFDNDYIAAYLDDDNTEEVSL